MLLGLIFAVLCALSKAVDTFINKDVMRNQSATNHVFYRIIFVTPILFIASLFNWDFNVKVIWYLLLFGLLEAINIFCHQTAIKKSNSLHIELVSKSKVIFALIVSFVLAIDKLSFWKIIGIAVFMIGAVMSINFQNKNDDKTTPLGLGLEIISVLARTFKPFILKTCIQKSLVSNETMSFLSMIVAFVILFACFRPKLDFKGVSFKKYTGQALVVGAGMLLSGWAVIFANTVIVNAIESTSVIFIMFLGFFITKKKYSFITILGSIISIIGIVLSIVL